MFYPAFVSRNFHFMNFRLACWSVAFDDRRNLVNSLDAELVNGF